MNRKEPLGRKRSRKKSTTGKHYEKQDKIHRQPFLFGGASGHGFHAFGNGPHAHLFLL